MASTPQPQDTNREFARAFNAGDIDSLVKLYTRNATLVPQPGQEVKGQAAIRDALQAFLQLKGRIELETTYVVQSGDMALMRSHWRLAGTGADGKPVTMEADSAEVAQRQADGSWLYVIDHPYGGAA